MLSLSAFSQSFSGRIVYSTNVESSDSTYGYIDYQKAKYGDSLIVSLGESGKMRKDYIGAGNPGFEFNILNPESEFSVHKFTYSDSIFLGNKSLEPTQLIRIDTLNNDIFLNRNCEVYKLEVLETNEESFQTWDVTVWLDKNIKIDSELYNDWIEGHWNVISGLNGGMYLKMITSNGIMSITYSAMRVEDIEIDDSLFDYDERNLILID